LNSIFVPIFILAWSVAMSRSQFFPVALALCALGSSSLEAAPPAVGERHLDFTLADISTNKPASLSDFRGKKVLLIQFASW